LEVRIVRTDSPTLEDVLHSDVLVATTRPVDVPDGARTVVLTSGTTGEAKPIAHTREMWEANAQGVRELLGVADGDRWLLQLPTHHMGGLSVLMRAQIWGSDVVGEGDAEWASLVPTQLARGWEKPPSLKGAVIGGGPMPAELPPWAIPSYGMTETCGMVWAGRPLPGTEFRTAPDGELELRGPTVAADGWLATGDLGRLDADGVLHIEGRKTDLIITGGENVAPQEVERVLAQHPGVEDVAVAGVADPEWGERLVALVVGDTAGLADWARERLPGFKVPKEFHSVETLPRNSGGKLVRGEIHVPDPG
jgi:o-succinylbenzoate---CoA ligase